VTINGGIDPATGNPSAAMTAVVKFFVPTTDGLEVLNASEFEDSNRESSLTHGMIEPLNVLIRAGSAGLGDFKQSVRVATAAALPAYTRTANNITANANGALAAVDGVTLVNGDRLLLKDGAAGDDNGLWGVTDIGTAGTAYVLDRTSDGDTSLEMSAGQIVPVAEGTVNADQLFMLTTNDPIDLNTTALTYSNFGILGPLVTAAARGVVNSLGAANAVLVTDGATAGGAWSTIVDANVNAAAAIAGTKVAPSFGAQNITTTGYLEFGGATVPATGGLRGANATGLYQRDAGDTADLKVVDLDAFDIVRIGQTTGVTGVVLACTTGSNVIMSPTGGNDYLFMSTRLRNNKTEYSFGSAVAAPLIWQETDTAGGVTGKTLTISSQVCSGAGSTGGALTLLAGTGVTANGALTLRSPSGAAVVQIDGSGNLGLNGATPLARPTYVVTNPSADRAFDVATVAGGAGLAELAAVVGTIITDLQARGDFA